MNLSEEDILSVSSFSVCLFCFSVFLSFCLFVCLFVISLKKREDGRAMGRRRHSGVNGVENQWSATRD